MTYNKVKGLAEYRWTRAEEAHLPGHNGVCWYMFDLADRASVSRAQILDNFQVFCTQVEVELDADFELRRCILRLIISGMTETGVLGGWRRLGSGGRQSQALDVLALHRARRKWVSHREW